MKQFVAIFILSILVNVLITWDFFNTKNIFKHMKHESSEIYSTLLTTPINDEDVATQILNLKEYWTNKMNVLVVSISRKDLQCVSDYLQFLDSAITNNDQESGITYALLLKYNIEGLHEISGFTFVNIL